MVTEVDRADTGRLNFDAFLALMAAKMAEKDSKEEILKVGGNGFFYFDNIARVHMGRGNSVKIGIFLRFLASFYRVVKFYTASAILVLRVFHQIKRFQKSFVFFAGNHVVSLVVQAFKLFDDDETGKISFQNLKRVADELGENLTDEELQVRTKLR